MKPPLHQPFIPQEPIIIPSSRDPNRIADIQFHSSIRLEENPPNSDLHIISQQHLKPNMKHFSMNKKPKKDDLWYSRGMSWSQNHEEGFYPINKDQDNNMIKIMTSERMNEDVKEKENNGKVTGKCKQYLEKIMNIICLQDSQLSKQTELIITINDLNSLDHYDHFINKLKHIDKNSIKQLRFKDLKHKFLIQQWKEIELRIRDWPLISLKFHGTRLDKEHCRTLLYLLGNTMINIEKLSFHETGLTSETLKYLFSDSLHLLDLKKLKKLSIKNNPSISIDEPFFKKFEGELEKKAKISKDFVYKVNAGLRSKKYNYLDLDFAESDLDDRKLKKIVLGLQDNHSNNEINKLNLSNNEKITENGWFLFTEKYLKTTIGLHTLNLTHCNLNDNSFKRICEGINKNEALNLHTLDLSNNINISSSGFLFFARKVLLKVSSLENLYLNKCGLNDVLIEGMVDGLLLNDENIDIVSKRCNMSISESYFISDIKLSLNLKTLDLSQNWNVSDQGWFKLLMPLLAMASKLEHLKMRDCVLNENKLKSITDFIGSLNLKTLDISNNQSITELVGWPLYANVYLSKSNRIENLNLSDCNIVGEKFNVIYTGLTKNIMVFETLLELNISNNPNIKDKDFGILIKEFGVRFNNLNVLILRKVNFSDKKMQEILLELEKQEKFWFKNLRKLDLSENPEITEHGMIDLTHRFLKNHEFERPLEEFYFEDMAFSDKQILIFLNFLREEIKNSRLTSLKTLSFSSNKGCSEITFQEMASFLKDFQVLIQQKKSQPISLNISNCQVNNLKISRFFDTFYNSKITMNCLDLSKNTDISLDGFQILSDSLNSQKFKVIELKLRNCRLDSRKLKDITLGYETENLDLSDNPNISGKEFENILIKCLTLKSLNLRQCNLKDNDFKVLSQILYNNKLTTTFSSMNLGFNKGLTAAGYRSFLLAFFAKEKALNISAWALKNPYDLDISQHHHLRTSMNTSLNDVKFKTVCNSLAIQKAKFPIKILDLSKNKISLEILEEFSIKVLSHSNELETLILDDCMLNDKKFSMILKYLENKPANLLNISLKGNNEITGNLWKNFFEIIGNSSLITLNIDNCGLDDQKITSMISGFSYAEQLKQSLIHLSLNNNPKILEEKFLDFIENFISQLENLEELNLAENELSDNKLKAMMLLLNKKSKLKKIDISGINKNISDFTFSDFVMNLRKLVNFKTLKLAGFDLTEGKVIHLASTYETILKKGGISGLEIEFQDNKGIPLLAYSILTTKAFKFKGVEKLSLENCELNDEILGKIIEILQINKVESGLKILDLSQNSNLNTSLINLFANISIIFPELLSFSLRECNLNSMKIENIQKGIQKSSKISSIKCLDLSGNKIIDEKSWALLSEILLEFTKDTLDELKLSDCELKNPTFKCFLDNIISKNITTLQHLDLSKNWAITETGLSDLFSQLILTQNFRISTLNLSECTLNDHKIKAISDNFNNFTLSKPYLRGLDISTNKSITENGWKLLGSKILQNLENLCNLKIFNCDLDCDSKISNGLIYLLEKSNKPQEFLEQSKHLSISINAQNLHEGLMVLQQMIHKGKVKSLKLKFLNDESLLKMFWSPLDFYEVLRNFYTKPKIDAKSIMKKSRNNSKDQQNLKTYLKSLIFEPKNFLPHVFENPLMNKYEDIILNDGLRIYLQENRLRTTLNNIFLINYDHTTNDSLLSRNEIYRINQNFFHTNLDSIYIDYTYNYSKFCLNELEMLKFLRLLPPKAFIIKEDDLNIWNLQAKKSISKKEKESISLNSPLRLRPSLTFSRGMKISQKITLNGLKALFATLYQNYNIGEIKIDYDYDSMLNQGIAFSLREKLYQTFSSFKVLKFLKFITYKILSLFVVNAKHFKFSSDIILLNTYFKSLKIVFFILMVFVAIYYFISIFLPFYFIERCGSGLAWTSHYIFVAFVVISLIFESILFALIYPKIRPVYLAYNNYALAERKTLKSRFKRRILILAYLLLSQVAHYDIYSKFSFIRITFECEQNSLGIVACVFMAIHVLIGIYHYFYMIFESILTTETRELNFTHINKFLGISHLNDFACFNNALDIVAPYNVVQIPDIWIVRKLTPHLAGLSINSKLYFFFLKFVLKNTPIVIVQIIFLFFRRDRFGESDSLVIAALITSLVIFLVDFYKFLSVRPSTIYQGDFDELVRRNKKKRLIWIKELVDERDRILDNFILNSDKPLREAISFMIENEMKMSKRKLEKKEKHKADNDDIEEEKN